LQKNDKKLVRNLRKIEDYPLLESPLTNLINIPHEIMYYIDDRDYVFCRIEGRSKNYSCSKYKTRFHSIVVRCLGTNLYMRPSLSTHVETVVSLKLSF